MQANNEPELPQAVVWAQAMGWSHQALVEFLEQNPIHNSLKNEALYQGVKRFVQKYKVSFSLASVYALDLLFSKGWNAEAVENHLFETLNVTESSQDPHNRSLIQARKTILLTGRSGEGKSTLSNQLVGKTVAPVGTKCKSETIGTNLYVSDLHGLSIVDSEGLDGTHPTKTNQQLMGDITEQTMFFLETDASIDAIIIMWCPLKNGQCVLAKTMKTLQESFGESIAESCIFMVQGDWRKYAEALDLKEAVPAAIKALKEEFPNIPIVEYDAKGSVEEQLPVLMSEVSKVKPYNADVFYEKHRELFYQMIEAFQFKAEQLPEKEKMKFCKEFQDAMAEALSKRGQMVQLKKNWVSLVQQSYPYVGAVAGIFASGLAMRSLVGTVAFATTGVSTAGVGFLGLAMSYVCSEIYRRQQTI